MTFLRYYLHFDKPEMITKFVQELTILTERSATMGIEELLLDQAEKKGIEKGMEKGKLEEAKSIAREMKKEGIPIAQIAKFTKISIEIIEKL